MKVAYAAALAIALGIDSSEAFLGGERRDVYFAGQRRSRNMQQRRPRQQSRRQQGPWMSATTSKSSVGAHVDDVLGGGVLGRPDHLRAEESDLMGGRRLRLERSFDQVKADLKETFGIMDSSLYDSVSKSDQLKAYEMMVLCRQFENSCNQAYMQGKIRGFMHLDNGQETIPALIADSIHTTDIKYSYYREHTHAIASGVSPEAVMAELYAKEDGTCMGTGGSMHVYDKDTHFQGGWALVAEQLPYAVGAARSILLDRERQPEKYRDDDRVAVVFVGEGGAQNGRMAECLNAAAKEKLPLVFVVIDNGRAINTFTPDVATNSDVFAQGKHYGIPGLLVDGQNLGDTLKGGRAVIDYVRKNGPAILQVGQINNPECRR